VDVAAHLDLPRQPRLLPETLTVDETVRLLEAAGGEPPDTREPTEADGLALRNRTLLELLYAAGLRVSEALHLDLRNLSIDGGFVRVIGKGDRERLVPVGDVALEWLARYLAWPRPGWLAVGSTPDGPDAPLFVTPRGKRLARQSMVDRQGRGRRRRPRRSVSLTAPAFLHHAPAGGGADLRVVRAARPPASPRPVRT
jgi:integrase/recombinase XerD